MTGSRVMNHTMRAFRILAATAALAAVLAAAPAAAQEEPPAGSCVVAYVVDGDTLNCEDGTRVRLLLVDAPEGGRFGGLARRALATLAPVGTKLTLETDSTRRDASGRVLAYAFLADGRFVNETLIRLGYALFEPDPPNERYVERLRAAEEHAKENGLGVWSS